MEKTTPRRTFLSKTFMASAGLALASSTSVVSAFSLNNMPISEHKVDLRTSFFEKQIKISGQIFDASGKNTLNSVQLEFWHQSPDSDIVEQRGSLLTDENGRYQLKSDYPSRKNGTAPTVHFKLSKNGMVCETELMVSEFDAFISGEHWEKNNQLKEELLFPKHSKYDLKTEVIFNISLTNQKQL